MTIAGLSGALLSHEALARIVQEPPGPSPDERGREGARRRLRAWHLPLRDALGPSSGARAVFDRIAAPLAAHLGFTVVPMRSTVAAPCAVLARSGRPVAVALATEWGRDPGIAWRDAVRQGIGHGIRWCFCMNGPALRVIDAGRAYSRRFAEFDLALALDDDRAFAAFWGLLRADALTDGTSADGGVLARAVSLSEQHRVEVRASLQHGVADALRHLVQAFITAAGRRQPATHQPVDESLIVVYRILFLLFAEARGLVPRWHPIYRDSYTIESLRRPVETFPRPPGVWEALQAIARLAHHGCRAGTLRVTAFNGRLFSPLHAPLADSVPLDDGAVRQALLALTTRPSPGGRERIAYADLGVEQLGGVYENLLDFDPNPPRGRSAPALSSRRKATGTFYTPRSLTEYLTRRTLAPLVEDAGPDDVLALRIVDPAMGSGAFLVAACRFLASAYEQALVREGGVTPADIGEDDRARFRRLVAQRCLFGVDINPMAVQLGRLSLWLATLAGDRPLTFLDHNLRTGNSVAGASIADLVRRPDTGRARKGAPLPLFPADALDDAMAWSVGPRLAIAREPGDTLEQVRLKEKTLAQIARRDSPLTPWRAAADLWCATWFAGADAAALRAAFPSLLDAILNGSGSLPAHVAEPLLRLAAETASRERFFHWTLEFPEIFHDDRGQPLERPGFDAVLGNPPWEMLRGDRAGAADRSALTAFTRGSGAYPLQGAGHCNLYQLFVERALTLARDGGRLGLVLPSGFATDQGSSALRRHVLERTSLDSFVTLENRDGIFPIHRSLKFLLLTLTRAGTTTALPARTGVRSPDALDALPDLGPDPSAVDVPRTLLERIAGPDLAVPDIRSAEDLGIVGRIVFEVPALGDPAGWNVRFGRELNATDDSHHFVAGGGGIPVIEGKLLRPFRVDVGAARSAIPQRVLSRLLDGPRTYQHPRLGYRDVAAPTNQLTLIAAIIPAGCVTTHTVFCLKDRLDEASQLFLCGMLNSFVANYLVRMRVGTHVTAGIVGHLRVPKPDGESPAFLEVVSLGRRLMRGFDRGDAARLQALAAWLYGLTDAAFERVLDTFPLVPTAERAAALAAFRYIVR